ncbi:MAG: hypothetical protein CMJ25_30790 [Phycisphaerae bacterium]|nr:hypothetical protein [Phycisphaerae bacterium]
MEQDFSNVDAAFDNAAEVEGIGDVAPELPYQELTETEQIEDPAASLEAPPEAPESGEIAGNNNPEGSAPVEDGGLLGSIGNALGTLRGGEGSGGADNWIDSLTGDLRDAIDNTFQGDQLTREEINTKQEEGAADAKENQNIGSVIADIPRAIAGAALGAGESIANSAEIIGDTARSIGGAIVDKGTDIAQSLLPDQAEQIQAVQDQLFTVAGVTDENNPISDKYEWAKWNLGKDEIGAQTGIGKVAQGFGEFGLLLAGTGGFGGMSKVGTAFAAAKGLGKVGVAAKAAAIEGLYGIGADMIASTKGEGNMANMIGDAFPHLKGTFLTALAVDEDDNPWEVATKTALDGLALGMPVGAVGAWISGARAGRKALAAGKTQDEAIEVAIKASTEKFEQTELELKVEISKRPQTQNLKEALKDTKPAVAEGQAELDLNTGSPLADAMGSESGMYRFEALEKVYNDTSNGIPPTWDDIANITPEYFTPGTRQVLPEFNSAVFKAADDLQPDTSLIANPVTGEVLEVGEAVNIDGAKLTKFDAASVVTFISQNRQVLSRDDAFLRVTKENGETVAELVRVIPDEGEAKFLNQIYDPQVLGTRGNNLRSAYTQPVEPQVVPPAKAVAQQVNAEASPFVTGQPAQRAVTNEQLAILSKATSEGGDKVLRDMVDANPISVEELSKASQQTIGEVVNAAGRSIADALGAVGEVDFNKIKLQKVGDDVLLTREGIVQVKGLMTETANAISDSAFKASNASDQGIDNINHLQNMTDQLKALLRIHKVSANSYSKYLSTYKIEVPQLGFDVDNFMQVPDGQTLESTIEQTSKLLDEMMDGVQSGDPKAKMEALRIASQLQLFGGDAAKLVGASASLKEIATSKGLSMMYNSMLSSPTTHLVNTFSNAFNTVYRPITALAGGDRRTQKAALASFHSFNSSVADAWKLASESFRLNQPLTQGNKGIVASNLHDRQLAEITQQIGDSGTQLEKMGVGFLNMMNDGIVNNPIFNWPSRLLTTSDEFFKTMVTRMEFNRTMMERAIDKTGLGGDGTQEMFENLLKSEYSRNFTKSGQVLNEDLLKGAKEVTFQTELEGNMGRFAALTSSQPALRLFFPFVKTGHNIMVYTGSHVPGLNMLLKESREVLMNPNADPFQKAVMKGRMAFGGMTIMTGGMLAASGMITGNGPSDPKRKKEWLKTHQPRSLKVGDKWVSLDRVEPFGLILSAVADIQYAFDSGDLEEDKAKYLSGYLMYALSANLTDRSFLQGLQPLGNLLNPKSARSLERLGLVPTEALNNFFPMAGARRALNNLLQPSMQEFNSEFDRLLSTSTAGLLGDKATSYDYLDGEAVSAPSGGVNALLPMRVVERGTDPVRDALENIEFNSSVIIEELGGVKLKPDHISRLQQLMGQTSIHKDLENYMVRDKTFAEQVEKYKEKLRNGHRVSKRNQFWYRGVEKIVRKHRDHALVILRQEFPDLDAEIISGQMESRIDRLPSGLEDLIEFN